MKRSFFILSLIILSYFIYSGCSQRSIKFDYQDTTDDVIENIQIETEPSDNCYLTDIIVSNVTFSSIFNKNTLLYIASVDYIVDKINLKIVKEDDKSRATIVAKFNGISDSSFDINSNEYSPYIPLTFGENKIIITVIAENNVDTKKYEIYVNRFNNNSQLSLLKLSEGILSGGSGVYSTTFSNNVDKISVIATARDENSTITIVAKFNGVEESADELLQNVFSRDIILNIGENLVELYVTAPDNVTKSLYLIKITRNDKVKPPAFNPGSGSFAGSQNITIATETVGAKIRYTTNGLIPTNTYGIEVDNGAEIAIAESATIKAIAYKEGFDDSEVVNATYIRLSSNNYLSSVTFSSGYLSQTFDKDIYDYSLILSNSVENITIRAVTEDPASLMTITAKIDGVNVETKTLNSNTDSDIINLIDLTGDIKIEITAPDNTKRSYRFGILRLNITGEVKFDPPGGAFSDSVTVTLNSDSAAAKIRYTTDGTKPSRLNGTEIANGGSVTLISSATIKAIAYTDGMDDSIVTEQSYVKLSDNADLSNIYFSEGAFDPFFNTGNINYILTISNSVNSIYFSVSSVEPTSTIKAIVNIMGLFEETYDLENGKEYNLNNLSSIYQFRFEVTSPSGVVKKTYTVNPVWLDVVDEPSVSFNNRDPATEGTWVFAYSLTDGCKIRYTTDGSDPTRSYGAEILNNSSFLLVGSCQLKLIAYKDGMDDSQVVLYDYVQTSMNSYLSNIIISDNAIGIAFNKTTYAYNFDVPSSLSSLTFRPVLESPDASIKICAKFDGINDTTADILSNQNSTPVILNTGINTVKLEVTAGDGESKSNYTINVNRLAKASNPVVSPEGGIFKVSQDVLLQSATIGAEIIYTLNGSDPTDSNGIKVVGGTIIVLTESVTLKTRAVKSGMEPSDIVTYIFTKQASGDVSLSMSISPIESGLITFNPSENITVKKGVTLIIDGTFIGATDWKWYVDTVLKDTDSTLNLDTSDLIVGKHYISVTAVKNGVGYSGSLNFIVEN